MGTLQSPKISVGVLYPYAAVVGDFNGDGNLDLAVDGQFGSAAAAVSVLLGKGDGTFQAPTTAFSGGGQLAVADLKGNGKLDLVLFSYPLLEVFLGKGDGTFPTTHSYMSALPQQQSGGPVVGDFNLDGKLDIASGNYVLLGNGDGTLQGQPAVPLGASLAATGDFNRDGFPDLATISVSGASYVINILLNDGSGGLILSHSDAAPSAWVGQILSTDLNHDGKMDLVVIGSATFDGDWVVSVLLGNGDGTFGTPTVYPFGTTSALGNAIAADFNRDNKVDLALPQADGSMAILLGNGDGTFQTPMSYYEGGAVTLMTADFNGDGILDIAAGGVPQTDSPQTALLFGNGDGTFKPASFALGAFSAGLAADFNNDGKADLLGYISSGVQILLGNGDGTFKAVTPWFQGAGIFFAADVNGDGILDAVGIQGGFVGRSESFGVYSGNGDGTFGPFIDITYFYMAGADYSFVQTADMNQDGKPDLVFGVGSSSNSGVFVLLNTTKSIPGTGFSPSSMSFPSQAVGTSSGPVPVTLTNTGAVALTVTGVSIVGANASQFSQTNNCTIVQPTTTCTIQVTFHATSVGNAIANLSVTDNAAGSPQQVPLAGVGTNGSGQEIGLSIPSGGSGSQTVQAGAMATYTLSIGGNGWSGQVSLSCSGAPKGASCSFPGGATMNVSGSSATQFKVTVSTMARTRSALIPSGHVPAPWLWAMLAVGLVVLPGSVKAKHAGAQRMGMLTLLLLLLCSCGGGGGSSAGGSNGTATGTYPLTVTASAGSVNQSVPLTLTVQ